ncbi:unnamed protein product [Rangifer tarandus platyrhynchus]|uniref:Uncharacterized protein n=1 Tax=Rangifer tarandus platyrhynchus TaxID=3082113 RepID=A0AC59ZBS8_RANTA
MWGIPGELQRHREWRRRWKKSPAPPQRTGLLKGEGPAPKSGREGTPGPPPLKPHGEDSVPRPKGARSRKSRPHADVTLAADAGRGRRPLEGGDELPAAGTEADNRGNARPGRRPERPLFPLVRSARLFTQFFSCLRAQVVVLAPPPPAFLPDRADLVSKSLPYVGRGASAHEWGSGASCPEEMARSEPGPRRQSPLAARSRCLNVSPPQVQGPLGYHCERFVSRW